MVFLHDIRDIIAAAGIGHAEMDGIWPLAIGRTPAGNDNRERCITLLEFGGLAPQARASLDFIGLQTATRGEPFDYDQARAKDQELYEFLHQWASETPINGTRYTGILCQQSGPHGPFYDANNRPVLKRSYIVTVSRNQ